MAIKRVGLSWISTSDRERAQSFFTKTLGLTIVEDYPEFGWMEIRGPQGGPVLGVGTADPDAGMPAGINAVITFVADNYEQTKQELTVKGILFGEEVGGKNGVPRMIIFADSDGNMFQLVEETPGDTDKY
jgi:catechol 2,3-dioxygenase-like lactoylglutathione lyase family enzyme